MIELVWEAEKRLPIPAGNPRPAVTNHVASHRINEGVLRWPFW
jgi:hypothetical protein